MFGLTLGVLITCLVRLLGGLLRGVHRSSSNLLYRWAPVFALPAVLDLAENCFSLAMLTDPFAFPDWWTQAHAALATAKHVTAIASPAVGFSIVGLAFVLRARAAKG